MSYFGSYRKLAANAKAAMVAAIEMYNKPNLTYRDEIVVILMVNAWELLAKSVVSKSKTSIYYPKRRNEPYRTLSLDDALRKATSSVAWPKSVDTQGAVANVRLLTIYRDNAIHFYNRSDFSSLLYSLMQTAITNFRDVHSHVSKTDIADEINWTILPLGVHLPVDPIDFLRGERLAEARTSPAIEEFISTLRSERDSLASEGGDSGRLLTIFQVTLQSVKKIGNADVIVGVDQNDPEATVLSKPVDPNKSHPLRQKDVLGRLGDLGFRFGQYEFLVCTTELGLRSDLRYCWTDKDVNLVRWTPEVVERLRRLSQDEVASLREAYKLKQAARQKR